MSPAEDASPKGERSGEQSEPEGRAVKRSRRPSSLLDRAAGRRAADFTIMGVVNVTPDSFSDGGRYIEPRKAIAHGLELAAEGAAVVDVGGESTRPGALPVDADEELARVLPVIEGLVAAATDAQISIDTSKASVASKALDAGATFVNDVTALRGDPGMVSLVASSGADLCLMHMLGEPRTMQEDPRYDDVVSEVKAFLEDRLRVAVQGGVPEERILLDPGIGFGKTAAHNLELVERLDEIVALGRPVVIGASRKSFIGRITGREDPFDRVAGTVAVNVLAYERGARVFRVHDVAPSRDALAMAAATVSRRWTERTRPTSSTT
jgi:dihydropteroate synthase